MCEIPTDFFIMLKVVKETVSVAQLPRPIRKGKLFTALEKAAVVEARLAAKLMKWKSKTLPGYSHNHALVP